MSDKNNVYFVGGCVARRGLICAISYLSEFAQTDAEHTRAYTYNLDSERWGHIELEHEIVSVVHSLDSEKNVWRFLSKRGVIVKVSGSVFSEEQIRDAGTGPNSCGYVREIRDIAGQLYVCGYRRQVYRFAGNQWEHIDQGILAAHDEHDYGFQSIDGTGPDNIYAVGWKGEIFHFNGKVWRKIDSLTTCNLHGVRCVSPKLVYICGDSGTFIRGYQDIWEVIITPDFTENLWDIEVYGNVPYVAYLGGLMALKGNVLEPVVTGLNPEIDGYRLHANDGLLWSFGHDHLGYFDGTNWKQVVCPDNPNP